MQCFRCNGLMLADRFLDAQGTSGFTWVEGWRCLNCGLISDPLIDQNRSLHEEVVSRHTACG